MMADLVDASGLLVLVVIGGAIVIDFLRHFFR